jgi:hypothetical protein
VQHAPHGGHPFLGEDARRGPVRAQDMDDQRTAQRAGGADVRPKDRFLALGIAAAPVQPALADGHRAGVVGSGGQGLGVERQPSLLGIQIGHHLGMDPHRQQQARRRHLIAQRSQRREPARADRGDQDGADPGGGRPAEHRRPIAVELRHIQVAMGIDHRKLTGGVGLEESAVWTRRLDKGACTNPICLHSGRVCRKEDEHA